MTNASLHTGATSPARHAFRLRDCGWTVASALSLSSLWTRLLRSYGLTLLLALFQQPIRCFLLSPHGRDAMRFAIRHPVKSAPVTAQVDLSIRRSTTQNNCRLHAHFAAGRVRFHDKLRCLFLVGFLLKLSFQS